MMGSIMTFLMPFLASVVFWLSNLMPAIAAELPPARVIPQQELGELIQKAFAATNEGDFAKAEGFWTQIIEQFPEVAPAWSHRGNSRVSQNKLESALADYEQASKLLPDAPLPDFNRAMVLEALGRWEEAIASDNRVLELNPQSAAAYNHRGNAEAGLGDWEKAIADYLQAANIAPEYAFARANYALALYQIGETAAAIRTMKNLVRKYPQFADLRAALTAALWEAGKHGEAESNWVAAVGLDRRYQDIDWVRKIRRWPPAMVTALDKFLHLP
jgi:tetratricopeptide (TPR) repeat protein